MYNIFIWLKCFLQIENIRAILGSLKRRIFRLDFLEMRIDLKDVIISNPSWDNLDVMGYSSNFDKGCISLLNSVGSLGYWRQLRFRKEILSTVENSKNDIFIVCNADSVIGFTVLHKRSLENNLNEIGYVAVSPECRGRKIGAKLLVHISSEMKKRGIYQAYLRTDSFRIPAIKTYLKVGFYPYIRNEDEYIRWQRIMERLGVSLDKIRF